MSEHGIAIDDRDPECIVVRWPARRVGVDELERFAREVIDRLAAQRESISVLVDVRNAAPLESAAFARLLEIDRRVCATERIAARAIVVPSAAAVRVLALALSLARPRVPTRAFDDVEGAGRWLRERR